MIVRSNCPDDLIASPTAFTAFVVAFLLSVKIRLIRVISGLFRRSQEGVLQRIDHR